MWIDTHCHPFSKPFKGEKEEIYDRARAAGVIGMIVVGYSAEGNEQALQIASENDDMWCALGIHPCDCDEWTEEQAEWIREQVEEDKERVEEVNGSGVKGGRKIVALGEMGLDYHHMSSPKDVQEKVFREQIRLAKELDLPCVIHSRDAAEDTLRILLEEKAERVIFHCYSYDLEFGKKVWAAGYYTSFSGVVTYPKAMDVQEAAKYAPLDKILIETDCPYLAPQSKRGKRNEMAFVGEIGHKIADLRSIDSGELSRQLKINTENCFNIKLTF